MKSIALFTTLIFSTATGLCQYWKNINLTDYEMVGPDGYYLIEADPDDNSIWISSGMRLYQIDSNSVVDFYLYSDCGATPFYKVQDIMAYQGSILVLDDMQGLYSYDGLDLSLLAPFQYGRKLNVDQEDSILIGTASTNSEGFFIFDGGYQMFATWNSPLTTNNVFDVLEDSYGRKWIPLWTVSPGADAEASCAGTGYDLIDGSTWTHFNGVDVNLPSNDIKMFIESPINTIWCATKQGYARFNEVLEEWVLYDMANTNIPGEHIVDLQFDKSGRMWAWFLDEGVGYTYNFVDWTIFDETNSPISAPSELEGLTIDTLNRVWILGEGEVFVYSDSALDGWLGESEIIDVPQQLNIFPNPTSHSLTITGVNGITSIKIFDLTGKCLNQSNENTSEIDVSLLHAGQYVVRVVSESGTFSLRFLKK